MSKVAYFAYGSNMLRRRLRARVPSAVFLGRGTLPGYVLAFHKISTKDGSGKCDIVRKENGIVYGALFRIAEAELADLDAYEGNNEGYVRRLVKVRDETGRSIAAQTYVATKVDPSLRPYTWYTRHVLEGAREANLPPEYVRTIEHVDTIDDCNRQRVSRELAIYV